ncbi:MAG: KpsF/GutQ family sugar-phosphate isomerase [Bacteroidia bacterium]|nr:KpsF/GutQ family sugar-phosphate isomerase [Bacteroidia bacterium]
MMDIISEIKKVINIEVEALLGLKKKVGHEFEKAINIIINCRGKVVVTGVGKSGIAAKKIASTLSSTGTPSVFMHPAEAMHGDLGIVSKGDIILAIGKSGESSELTSLFPAFKKIKIKLIVLTTNNDSRLAKAADIVLNMGEIKEACPFNLAPTSSVITSIAIGDAIAIVLMKMREFKIEDFALFHPGGRLGKRLTLIVEDVMLKGQDNPIINISDTTKNMFMAITEKKAGAVSVVDKKGKLAGLVTDYDIRKILMKEENIFELKIKDIMNKNPVFIYNDEKAFDALKKMKDREKPITVLPVLNRNHLVVGIIRMHDLINIGL